MMKWVAMIALAIGGAVALAAAIGSRLPRAHRASREAHLDAPPEAIWAAITDVDGFPAWRADVKRVQRLPDRDGQRVWVEEATSGKLTFRVERSDPPRRLVTRIADPDLPFGGTWTYDIVADGKASRLTITEDGEIYNPVFRLVARFFLGYDATIASYLAALERKFPAG